MDSKPSEVPMRQMWLLPVESQEKISARVANSYRIQRNVQKSDQAATQRALYPVMFIAQCFGIFPVSGKLQGDINRLRFSAASLSTTFSLVLIILSSGQTTFPFNEAWFRGEISFDLAREFVFDLISTSYLLAFLRLAKSWKEVMKKWSDLEGRMIQFQPVSAARKIALFTGVFMAATFLEHFLSLYPYDASCNFTWETHIKYTHGPLFRFTDFALWKGIVSLVINFFMTIAWNFADLFLSTVSIALGSKFTQFNLELEYSLRRKEYHTPTYWKKMREIYNNLALLTKFMDKTLSCFVVLSYFNNLFFICFQLLNNIKLRRKRLYFAISFGHILFRFCCVSLTAAAIYERSKKPTRLLFSVPHDSYNVEVHRLLLQVLLDRLTLTGYNFFSITKGLLLTVAGTILTYEIFLVQLDHLKPDDFISDEVEIIDCLLEDPPQE